MRREGAHVSRVVGCDGDGATELRTGRVDLSRPGGSGAGSGVWGTLIDAFAGLLGTLIDAVGVAVSTAACMRGCLPMPRSPRLGQGAA